MSEENEPQYIDAIPEEYREVPSIRDAGSMENLLKQHVHLETKMGNSLSFPAEDADDAQWDGFYSKVQEGAKGLLRVPGDDDEEGWSGLFNKLGRPEDATAYKFPEIKYGDDEKVLDQSKYGEGMREVAHKLGVNAKQFTGLMQYLGETTIASQEDSATAKNAAMTELKQEWGDALDGRVQRVQQLVLEQGGQDAADAFGDIGNNPAVIKMLDKIAESMMEEGSLSNKGPAGDIQTRTKIEDDIAALKGNEAYGNRRHQDHERTVNRVNALYEKLEAYKEKAA